MLPRFLSRALLAIAVAGLLVTSSRADVLLSNFNNFSTQLFPPMGISWTNGGTDQYIQNVGSISIAPVGGGNPKGDGYFYAGLPGGGSFNFAGLNFFNLSARVDAGNASSVLNIIFDDDQGIKVGSATFLASDFTSSFTTLSKPITYTGLGDAAQVTYFRIDGDGIASNNFRYSFENLNAAVAAVPEPSSFAIAASVLLGLSIVRREWRRRRAALLKAAPPSPSW